MSAGAFSDPAVIAASKKLVCVFVDCNWGRKNTDLSTKFAVRGYPTVEFLDPEGKRVASLESREPSEVAAQISEVARKYTKPVESLEKAVPLAKEDAQPILCLFVRPGAPSSLAAALDDSSMKDLVDKFFVVRSEIGKANADAKSLSVTDPALFVFDPAGELTKEKALLKLSGRKEVKEVRKQLEAALKKFSGDAGGK